MAISDEHYEKSQRLILWIAYGLHILLFPALLGAIINIIKLREYKKLTANHGAEPPPFMVFLISHHQWLLKTFIVFFILLAISVGTSYYGVGYVVAAGSVAWWIYRMARGVLDAAEGKQLPG